MDLKRWILLFFISLLLVFLFLIGQGFFTGKVVDGEYSCGQYSMQLPIYSNASSNAYGSKSEKAYDGSLSTYWQSTKDPVSGKPTWIYFDLGERKCLKGVEISGVAGEVPATYTLQISDDLLTWQSIGKVTINEAGKNTSRLFSERRTRYVRMYVESVAGDNAFVSEFRANTSPLIASPPIQDTTGNLKINIADKDSGNSIANVVVTVRNETFTSSSPTSKSSSYLSFSLFAGDYYFNISAPNYKSYFSSSVVHIKSGQNTEINIDLKKEDAEIIDSSDETNLVPPNTDIPRQTPYVLLVLPEAHVIPLSNKEVLIFWNISAFNLEYKIERSQIEGYNYIQVTNVSTGRLSYVDMNLSGSTVYYYRLTPFNLSSQFQPQMLRARTFPASVENSFSLKTPKLSKVSASSPSEITISWEGKRLD